MLLIYATIWTVFETIKLSARSQIIKAYMFRNCILHSYMIFWKRQNFKDK